jgi:hypothetical protein
MLRPAHQAGSTGIPLDVTADCQEVFVVLDGKGLVATLIYGPLSCDSPEPVPSDGVSPEKQPHERGKFTVGLRM